MSACKLLENSTNGLILTAFGCIVSKVAFPLLRVRKHHLSRCSISCRLKSGQGVDHFPFVSLNCDLDWLIYRIIELLLQLMKLCNEYNVN